MKLSKLFIRLRVTRPATAITLSAVMAVGLLMGGSPANAATPEMAAAQQVSAATAGVTSAPASVSSAAASNAPDQQLPFDPPAACAHLKMVFGALQN